MVGAMASSPLPDYYEILDCQANDSIDVIKKSYQSLILKHHPDKSAQSSSDRDVERSMERFHAIDEAWKVLRDVEKRKQYDAEKQQHRFNDTPIVHAIVRRNEFEWNAEMEQFVYPCRCGGLFVLPMDCATETPSPEQIDDIFIECDECSFVIQFVGNAA